MPNESAGHVQGTIHDRSRRPRRHLQEAHKKSRLQRQGIETTAATPIGQEAYQRFGRQPATGLGGLDNSSRDTYLLGEVPIGGFSRAGKSRHPSCPNEQSAASDDTPQ